MSVPNPYNWVNISLTDRIDAGNCPETTLRILYTPLGGMVPQEIRGTSTGSHLCILPTENGFYGVIANPDLLNNFENGLVPFKELRPCYDPNQQIVNQQQKCKTYEIHVVQAIAGTTKFKTLHVLDRVKGSEIQLQKQGPDVLVFKGSFTLPPVNESDFRNDVSSSLPPLALAIR